VARLEKAVPEPARAPLAPAQPTVGTTPPVSLWIDPSVAETLRGGPRLPLVVPVMAAEEPAAEPEVAPPAPERPSPLAQLGERFRAQLRGEEWEAVVGGSW